ncbi:hypothetical protein L0F63_004368 [Massospora cicadina]|nr:hypothetical protein L0F63_004368 [Massospora cicadina]
MNIIVNFPNPTGSGVKAYTLKVTPNTPLTEVIKLVVTKFDLGDHLAFGLRHKREVLDASLTMRFANLASGTKLDLVPIGKLAKGQAQITVALQLEGGQRMVDRVLASTTLWGLLQLFASRHPSAFEEPPPNGEVSGLPQLNETTLQGLGITSGNIAIRLTFKPSQVAYLEICAKIQDLNANVQVQTKEPISTPVPKAELPAAPEAQSPVIRHEAAILERGLKVFKAAENDLPLSARLDLPDSYFELSATELKVAMSAQQARTRQLMEGAPLKPKATLAKEKQAWLDKHPTTAIRVRFPDATQIQAAFASIEPISALGEVIRSALHNPARPFVLAVAPPYRTLDLTSTASFYTLGLVPSALIHLRFTNPNTDTRILAESLLATAETFPPPLHPQLKPTHRLPMRAFPRRIKSSIPKRVQLAWELQRFQSG